MDRKDGDFEKKDENGIKNFTGSKTSEKNAIGRFGMGLKSIFHFCDMFFFLSSRHYRGEEDFDPVCEFNPWEGSQMHANWGNYDRSKVGRALGEEFDGWLKDMEIKDWFLIWVPIRKIPYPGPNSTKGYLTKGFDMGQFEGLENKHERLMESVFGKKLESEITITLPFLRTLSNFKLVDEDLEVIVEVEREDLGKAGENPGLKFEPAEGIGPRKDYEMAGKVKSNSSEYFFRGKEIFNQVAELEELKSDKHWPETEKDGNEVKQKGFGHGAVNFLRREDSASRDEDAVGITRCMFLPLSKGRIVRSVNDRQLSDKSSPELEILIHGYYFLDSARTNVDNDDKLKEKWNRAISKNCIAHLFLPCFEQFIKDASLPVEKIKVWTSIIRKRGNQRDQGCIPKA